jgi:hypothetical protein
LQLGLADTRAADPYEEALPGEAATVDARGNQASLNLSGPRADYRTPLGDAYRTEGADSCLRPELGVANGVLDVREYPPIAHYTPSLLQKLAFGKEKFRRKKGSLLCGA